MWICLPGSGSLSACPASCLRRLTDDIRQPTLISPKEDRISLDSGQLTLFDLVAVRVLELSSSESAPLTPSPVLTRHLLSRLAQRGVIRLGPTSSEEANNRPLVRSVYESISWAVSPSRCSARDAEADLREYVTCPNQVETVRREQLELWLALGTSELDGYARHLLRKSQHADLVAGRLVTYLRRLLERVCIASVRRAIWIHCREQTHEAPSSSVAEEVRLADDRAARICATAMSVHGHNTTSRFVPSGTSPIPLIRRVFIGEATFLHHRYWACTPSLSALDSEANTHERQKRI